MRASIRASQGLQGRCKLPGDKSLSHRAALFAALATGESRFENMLDAGVTRAMLDALTQLGVQYEFSDGVLRMQGKGPEGLKTPQAHLDCGHSATTMRLLAGALGGAGVGAVLDGSSGLRRRPMARVAEPLRAMGVAIQTAPGGTAPLQLEARPVSQALMGGSFQLKVASAQVKTAILLAGLGAQEAVTVQEPGPSRDHTERLLAAMGAAIEQVGKYSVRLHPTRSPLQPLRMRLPGDISSAAFLMVAALISPHSDLELADVGLNPTRAGILDALDFMGADIRVFPQAQTSGGEPVGDVQVKSSSLRGVLVEGPLVVRMIDEFPAFAVAAAFAQGRTEVRQAAELRYKESDRITALCTQLARLGAQVEEGADGFVIHGGRPLAGGVQVEHYGDHRLAMALCIAGLRTEDPVVVDQIEIIEQSFPGFLDLLGSLGAEVRRWA